MLKILGTPNGTRDTLRKGRKVRENIQKNVKVLRSHYHKKIG